VSVTFTPAVPDKAFQRNADSAAADLTKMGFLQQGMSAVSFEFGPDGRVAPLASAVGSTPRILSRPDQTTALTIAPDHLVFATQSYVRWQPFIGDVERYAIPVISAMLEIVSIASVRLEYWDRFTWSGTWADFDVQKLLQPNCPYFAPEAARQAQQWHSHAGWFTKDGALRRLTNINIDVVDVVKDLAYQGQPSVGIYSSLTDQPNVPGYETTEPPALDAKFIVDRLENQHLALKAILGHIIVDEMANRIGLDARKTA